MPAKRPVTPEPVKPPYVSTINFAVYLGDHGNKNLSATIRTALTAIQKLHKSSTRSRVEAAPLTEYELECLEAVTNALDEYDAEIMESPEE